MKKFAYKGTDGKYYNNWAISGSPNLALVNAGLVKQEDNSPIPGKVYIHDSGVYFSTGTDLVFAASVTKVENSLSSTSTANALSAAQGKALNDKYNTLNTSANTLKSALTIK